MIASETELVVPLQKLNLKCYGLHWDINFSYKVYFSSGALSGVAKKCWQVITLYKWRQNTHCKGFSFISGSATFVNLNVKYHLHFVNHTFMCICSGEFVLYEKNPAYGRHQLSRPMRIIGPIQIWSGCMNYPFFFN